MLYIIEGQNGCGKTTLINNLKKYSLKNDLGFRFFREPGGTEFGNVCRSLLLRDEFDVPPLAQLYLMLAARAEFFDYIKPYLDSNDTIIVDRGILSTFIYQHKAIDNITSQCIFDVQPIHESKIIYLDGPKHDISSRLDNNWMDFVDYNEDVHVKHFIQELRRNARSCYIKFEKLRTYDDAHILTEDEMLQALIKLM